MKKFIRGLVSILLKLSLFNLALASAFTLVFGTPDLLKQSLRESKIYDSVVTNVIKSSEEANRQEGFPVNEPGVRAAIDNAFPPATIQAYAEEFINGSYRWLNGEVEAPDFRIDLGPAKQKLAEGVGGYALQRYNNLPACTLAQLRTLSPQVDPLQVPCQVPGVSAEDARQEVVTAIASSDQFLADTLLTAEDLPKDPDGKTAFDAINYLPGLARLSRLAPWLLGALCLLLGAGLIALHDKKRSGFRSVGGTLAGTGLFVLISTLIVSYLFAQINKPDGVLRSTIPGGFQESMLSVIRSLNAAMNRYLIMFSIVYLVLGVSMLLYLHFTDKKLSPAEQQALLDSLAAEKNQPAAAGPTTDRQNNTKV